MFLLSFALGSTPEIILFSWSYLECLCSLGHGLHSPHLLFAYKSVYRSRFSTETEPIGYILGSPKSVEQASRLEK